MIQIKKFGNRGIQLTFLYLKFTLTFTYSIIAFFLSDLKELVPCLQLAAETGHAPGVEAAYVSPHHIPVLTETVLYSSGHSYA